MFDRMFARLSLFALLCVPFGVTAKGQTAPNAPDSYKGFFVRYSNQPSLIDRMLKSVGVGGKIGRSFALIAGVTKYPNLGPADHYLRPADVDITNLTSYLQTVEDFDEIVVLKDDNMTAANLNYFLNTYFPRELGRSTHSRFLFAYSGHGYAENQTDSSKGYLLTGHATSFSDRANGVDMEQLRKELSPDIENAEKVLVLINACQSGAFLNRPFGGGPLDIGSPGAHAILASRNDQKSYQLPEVGPGSVFFETIFAGLRGAADNNPSDGVVTFHELDNYLHRQIPLLTHDNQNPMEGDLARAASKGEFFFLNRTTQVLMGNSKPWPQLTSLTFGEPEVDDPVKNAVNAHTWSDTVRILDSAASNGNMEAKEDLIILIQMELPAAHLNRDDLAKQKRWFTWCQEVANQGNNFGMEALAVLLDDGTTGDGVKHPDLARQWHEAAAAKGNTIAMIKLADILDDDGRPQSDHLRALELYKKCADLGDDPECMVKAADFYEDGEWVAQDYIKARTLYELAAKSDIHEDAESPLDAMDKLVQYYKEGLGVRPDQFMANAWAQKAAQTRQQLADERVKRSLERN